MDPRFVATPSVDEIRAALSLWPELASLRVRPLLVSAFGEIFVESEGDGILAVDPIELSCETIAPSVPAFEELFSDSSWAEERLMVEVLLLANERGVTRAANQVFALAPHPSFTGEIRVEHLMPMDLPVWHQICSQLRA